MHSPVICTIIAKNYLAQARNLTESFLEHHPDGKVFVLFADLIDGYFKPEDEKFIALEARDLNIPEFEQMAFRYTILEFNTAVKPFLLEYLFVKYNLEQLCYFDPDIYFYQPITRIQNLLENHSVVLTPHLLKSLEDDRMPDEAYILRAGVYNLGFIGLSDTPSTRQFIRWWQQKLERDCVVDSSRGLFVDQRWIDFLPAFYDDIAILRDAGHNVAYWNLKNRHVSNKNGTWLVNDTKLTFFHFSGLPLKDINAISKHQNRYTLQDMPELQPLFSHYHERLLANGQNEVSNWPYAYGKFSNGVRILDAARHLWRNLDGEKRWPEPFNTQGATSFYRWLNQDVFNSNEQNTLLTNLSLELYRQRWDLQQAFPDVQNAHREAYAHWFVQSAAEQYQLDIEFIDPIRNSIFVPSIPLPSEAQDSLHTGFVQNGVTTNFSSNHTNGNLQHRKRLIVEAPLIGTPTLKRRVYYAIRNPLRRLGIHESIKQFVGSKFVETIYARMVSETTFAPETLTRSPYTVPAVIHQSLSESVVAKTLLEPDGLNVIGYLRAETGMGEVPRSVLRSLEAAGYPIAQYDLSNSDWTRSEDTSVLHIPQGNPYKFNLFCVNADMIPQVFEQLGEAFFADKYNIGFWHWETGTFPMEWYDSFQYLDEIWVDSGFTQKTLAFVSPVPIVNLPLAINAMDLNKGKGVSIEIPADKFVFLFSFDMMSFIQRKNPYDLIEAYRRAFGTDSSETCLVIKVTNLHKFPEEAQRLKKQVESVSGVLIDRHMDRAELAALFARCDSYVSLHRSEGFGLTMAEAMALGKPVIATAYSGNMEFMTHENSYPVGYKLVEIDNDYGPYRRGDLWAAPSIEQAAKLMRQVFSNPQEAKQKAEQAANDIQVFFSSSYVGTKIIERLGHISRHHINKMAV